MNTLDISLTAILSFGNSIKMHTELNIVNFRQLYCISYFHHSRQHHRTITLDPALITTV